MTSLARPCSARGWPSNSVAALGAVPGVLNRIAVTDPPKLTPPSAAAMIIKADAGSESKVNGISSESATGPPSPGRAPIRTPSSVAPTSKTSPSGVNTVPSAAHSAVLTPI
jgi:hypothetical protein